MTEFKNNGKLKGVKVAEIKDGGKVYKTYGVQSEKHWNAITNGFITANDGQLGFLNRFYFDKDAMTYDKKLKEIDLLKYGRCGYILFKDLVSAEFFKKNRLDEFSVVLGKGLMTAGYFRAYLRKFQSFLLDKCNYEVYTN